jgi:hypothetical protein
MTSSTLAPMQFPAAKRYLRGAGRYWRSPFNDKLALLEASVLLTFAQLLTKFVPYARWSRLLGPIASGEALTASAHDDLIAKKIAWLVDTAARYLPSGPVCLPRAMAAKWMLARRRVPSTLLLGIRRQQVDALSGAQLHAWLRAGDRTITGGDSADGFTVMARYGTYEREKRAERSP